MSYRVRPMNADDIPQVSAIDREAFPTEWPPPSFKRELNSSMVRYLVALDDQHTCAGGEVSPRDSGASRSGESFVSRFRRFIGRNQPEEGEAAACHIAELIVGYASIWMMVDESHVTSIAVRKSHQHQGIGELLLIAIIRLSMELKAQVVTLEARASNRSAQALYSKYGFKTVGIRRRYYTDNGEDAVIMTTDKLNSAPYQALFHGLEERYAERHGRSGPAKQAAPYPNS